MPEETPFQDSQENLPPSLREILIGIGAIAAPTGLEGIKQAMETALKKDKESE
jgi:hypothetical protein